MSVQQPTINSQLSAAFQLVSFSSFNDGSLGKHQYAVFDLLTLESGL